MTATEWAHLPNAALIDRILADAAVRLEPWNAAGRAAADEMQGTAWVEAWHIAWDMSQAAGKSIERDAVWEAGWAVWVAAHDEAREAARGATFALIAWDDASLMLDMPVPALRLFAANGSHAAVLMLPAAIALGGKA